MRFLIAFVLSISSISVVPAFAEVWVFTDSAHPVINLYPKYRIVLLNKPAQVMTQLNKDLPADPRRAETMVKQRLTPELHRTMQEILQGVIDAKTLGVQKIPAVVVDRQYVIYGENNVRKAVQTIEQQRRQQ